ncbi:MAG: hypothetical protein WC834_04525 [Eubacteriales bacterium]
MDIKQELAGLRLSDRRKKLILISITAVLVLIGIGLYISKGEAYSTESYYPEQTSYQTADWGGAAGYDDQNSGQAGSTPGGGGCCGGGAGGPSAGDGSTAGGSASAGSAGGCGSGGSGGCGSGAGNTGGAADAALPDLEKQALEKYKKETGKTDVKAKAQSYGCHTQIDITDSKGKVIRSYGYQGGPLYVIK